MRFRPLCIFALLTASVLPAQTPRQAPLLGAEVWIEPGQSPEQIDGWFRQLEQAHMPVARVFLLWADMETAPGKWDYSLYDAAFRAAERHHVRIVATLTPAGPPTFLGGNGNQGEGYPATQKARAAATTYIENVVNRYKSSPALDTWLLVNEPGMAPAEYPLAVVEFRQWLAAQYPDIRALNRSWGSAYTSFDDTTPNANGGGFASKNRQLDWLTFWRTYQTEQLQWLRQQIRMQDPNPAHGIHANPHALISNLAGLSDDPTSWRSFLTSLGCSIHPGWHFGLLNRDQYALGVSYINDLVAGAAEPKPHWVTELQGGNNIYSATKPIDPSPEDIAQWVWTSIGSGADRVIFWLLNARGKGTEAAEWSMLDFQQNPTQRLDTASKIAELLESHADFFSTATTQQLPIAVIVSLETMTLEEQFRDADFPGRGSNAHLLAALGMYQALSQIGVPPRLKFFNDYDWRARTPAPRIAIVPDARAITEVQVRDLEAFANNGNTLVITGLTGFYDPHAKAWPLSGFPLARVTGGDLKEVHFIDPDVNLTLDTPPVTLPSHLWVSSIENHSAQIVGERNGEITATIRRTSNGGAVIWIPSPVDIGGWLRDTQPLASYLASVLPQSIEHEPFRFPKPQQGCLMRVLKNADTSMTMITNGTGFAIHCSVLHTAGLHGKKLWGDLPQDDGSQAVFSLPPRATAVTLWH